MAERQVRINYAVTNKGNNVALTKTLTTLISIKEAVAEINKSGINLKSESIVTANKAVKNLDKSLQSVKKTAGTTNIQLKNMKIGLDSTAKSAKTAKSALSGVAGSLAMLNIFKRILPQFLQFENSVYNLGVVSNLSKYEIEDLKTEMLKLGAQFPQTATEITQGVDTIKRTGQTLADSMMVVGSASKLATASGEELASTIQIVNKILVAMNISAEDSAESMATLHSVAVNTATDLNKMGQASKYWSSALATFSNMSTRSGEELEQYKQELFDFGAVASGVFANLGRDSTMAGTGIRTLVSKVAMMEKTASEMFNKDVLEDAIKVDPKTFEITNSGIALTSELLSKMAMEDLPATVNLLSELFTKGILELPTIQKMFTTRQGLAIASFLQGVGGDWDSYSERIKTASNLTEDYEKQLNNLNNQLGILKGNLRNAFAPIGEDMKNVMGTTTEFFNFVLSGSDKISDKAKYVTPVITGMLAGMTATTTIASVSKLISTLTGGMTAVGALTTVISNPITLVIGGLTTAIALYMKYKNTQDEIIFEQQKSLDEYNKTLKTLTDIDEQLQGQLEVLKKIKSSEIPNHWDELKLSLEEYRNELEGLPQLSEILDTKNASATMNKIKSLMSESGEIKYKTSGIDISGLESELEKNLKQQSKIQEFRKRIESKGFGISTESQVRHTFGYTIDDLKEQQKILQDGINNYNSKKLESKNIDVEIANLMMDYIGGIQQETDKVKQSIDNIQVGLVKKIISNKDFTDFKNMSETISKYSTSLVDVFNNSEVKGLFDGLSSSQEKTLVNNKEFLSYATSIQYFTEQQKDAQELIAEKQEEINKYGSNTSEIEALKIKALQEEIVKQNIIIGGSEKQVELIKEVLKGLAQNVKQSEKITLPFVNLNNALDQSIFKLNMFGKAGVDLFKEQKKEVEGLYNKLEEDQLRTVTSIGEKLGYSLKTISSKDLDILKEKLESFGDIEILTADDKSAFTDYNKLYNEIDKYLAMQIDKKLKIKKIEADRIKYINDFTNSIYSDTKDLFILRKESQNINTDDYKRQLIELRANGILLKLKVDQAKESKDSLEISKAENEVLKNSLNIDILKLKTQQNTIRNSLSTYHNFQSHALTVGDFYSTSSTQQKNELDLKKQQLQEDLKMYEAQKDEINIRETKVKLMNLETDELLRQKQIYMENASIVLSMATSLSKGQAYQADFTSSMQKGIATLFDPEKSFSDLEFGDKLGAIAGSMQLIDNMTDTMVTNEINSLKYEQSILDLRIQGAKTEEEKTTLEKEQLELQKRAIELQYQQQTSYMGISGTSGSAVSSAVSSAVAGATIGGVHGSIIGGAIGAIGGLLGGGSAKNQADNQKAQLENQYVMTKYLETIANNTETSNEYMKTLASSSIDIGVGLASQKAMNELVRGADLGGVGTANWKEKYKEWVWKGLSSGYKTKTRTKTAGANVDLSDIGMSYDELMDAGGMTTAISKTEEKISELTSSLSNLSGEAKAKAEATVLAYKDMLSNLETISSSVENLRPEMFSAYFGASLESFEEDGVTKYTSDWSGVLASVFTIGYENAMNNISGDINGITSQFFSGLSNLYIKNFSDMSDVATKIKDSFKELSEELSKTEDELNDVAVESKIKELIVLTEEYAVEQQKVNEKTDEFISTWINNGGKLSDVYDSMTESMKGIYDATLTALDSDSYESMASSFGSNIGKMVTDSWAKQLIDAKYSEQFQSLNQSLMDSINNNSISSMASLVGQSNQLLAQLESDRRELDAISSVFNYSNNNDYLTENNNLELVTGTTKDIQNNYYITTQINPNVMIADEESTQKFFVSNANTIKNAISNVKG